MSKFKLSGGYTYDPDFLPAGDEDESEEETEQEQSTKRVRVKKTKALVIGDSQAQAPNGLGAAFQKKLNNLGYETERTAYQGESADIINNKLPDDFKLAGNPGLVVAIVGGNGTLAQTKAGVQGIIDFCQNMGSMVIIVGPGLATKIDNIQTAQQVFNDPTITDPNHWTTGPGKGKNTTRQAASDDIDDLAEDGVYGYGIATNMKDGGELSNAYASQPDGVHIVNGAQRIADQILSSARITSTPAEEEPEGTVADEEKFNSTVTGLDLRVPKNYSTMTSSDVENSAKAASIASTIAAYKSAPAPYDSTFDTAGAQYNIDPNFLRAVAAVESRFVIDARSDKGAGGLMQFMPETATFYKLEDRDDPVASINAAAKMLADHRSRLGADNLPELAGTYNGGAGYGPWASKKRKEEGWWGSRMPRMDAYVGHLPETRDYMQQVMAAYHEFGGTGYL